MTALRPKTQCIYRTKEHPPITVTVVEVLPSGWVWVRIPGAEYQYKRVNISSLRPLKESPK